MSNSAKKPGLLYSMSMIYVLYFLFGLLLPTQLGRHFWPDFSYLNGIRIDYLAPTLYLTDIFLIVLVLLRMQDLWAALHKIRRYKSVALLTVAFLIIGFVGASEKYLFLYRLSQYLKIFLTFLLFTKSDKICREWFLKGLFVSGIYVFILGLFHVFTGHAQQGVWWFLGERTFAITTPGISTVSLNGKSILRPYATFSHPNSMAGFYLITLFIFMREKKVLWAIIPFFIIIISFSKIVILSALFLWLLPTFFQKKICRVCVLTKALIVACVAYLTTVYRGDPQTLVKRVSGWKEALAGFLKTPLWGGGPGHYFYFGGGVPQPIHNIALLMLAEWGLIGLIIISFLGWMVWKNVYISTRNILIIGALVLTSAFDHYNLTLQQNMLLVGVALAYLIDSSPRKKIHH